MAEQNAPRETDKKLTDSIDKFMSSYKSLSPTAKKTFELQINNQIKTMDKRTRMLYEALVEAAKGEMNIQKTITEMEKADNRAKHGI